MVLCLEKPCWRVPPQAKRLHIRWRNPFVRHTGVTFSTEAADVEACRCVTKVVLRSHNSAGLQIQRRVQSLLLVDASGLCVEIETHVFKNKHEACAALV
jgi:hypothetical protein